MVVPCNELNDVQYVLAAFRGPGEAHPGANNSLQNDNRQVNHDRSNSSLTLLSANHNAPAAAAPQDTYASCVPHCLELKTERALMRHRAGADHHQDLQLCFGKHFSTATDAPGSSKWKVIVQYAMLYAQVSVMWYALRRSFSSHVSPSVCGSISGCSRITSRDPMAKVARHISFL